MDSGRDPSGQALAAPAEPTACLGPSGIDPSRFEPSRLERAIGLAVRAHYGQQDKGDQPYILHPLRVMLACPPHCQIAAVLHDVVEDSFVTFSDIEMEFGAEIADAVDALTRRGDESYIDFIHRCGANDMARTVKLADLTDNMKLERLGRDPTATDARRQQKYHDAYSILYAIAMEARQGGDGETRLHPKDDSAAIAQTQSAHKKER